MVTVCSTYSEPFCRLMVFVESSMVTGFTVTLQVAESSVPSVVVAVILALPTFTPFTTPSWVTVAIFSLSLVHFKVLLSASSGVNFTSICLLNARSRDISLGISIWLTFSGVTCIVVEAEMPEPSVAVAVMTASPTLCAVITPVFSSTEAISVALLLHFSF